MVTWAVLGILLRCDRQNCVVRYLWLSKNCIYSLANRPIPWWQVQWKNNPQQSPWPVLSRRPLHNIETWLIPLVGRSCSRTQLRITHMSIADRYRLQIISRSFHTIDMYVRHEQALSEHQVKVLYTISRINGATDPEDCQKFRSGCAITFI